MGKRSDFSRVPRDFYPTPYEAVVPLLPHVPPESRFIEPCAGEFDLVRHLTRAGLLCISASDTAWPATPNADARSKAYPLYDAEFFITNPPWSRDILHPIIENLSEQLPTWLLFDADWMHTRQSAPFMPYLHKIVSVGHVKWIPDSPFTGKDNCCWYLFDQTSVAPAQFVGRAA